ncbi:MAG: hypothetical protein KGD63_12235 [Candidatus Lokiarchaeota archaeon]|nr:hypothetical protein [Candidatus Lokiarchaeota archaeon]
MSLQKCLASRKDCSGKGTHLEINIIKEICKTTHNADTSKSIFIVLPDTHDYKGGVYIYNKNGLSFLSDEVKTNYTMELYPELMAEEPVPLKELIRVGLTWQYFSLKIDSIGLGVSQRAKAPKKINQIINKYTNQNHILLYSVVARERNYDLLQEDSSVPLKINLEKDIYLLETPLCYRNRAIYENKYEGIPLETAIFEKIKKKNLELITLDDLSQLLWACQGETDHSSHGNRDNLEKNGYGRVHASGCAGYAVYPIIIVKKPSNLPKGAYFYNPIGFSGLNRWIQVDKKINYDHYLQKYYDGDLKSEIEKEFNINTSYYLILLCVDRKKPCAGLMQKIINTKYWAEIEAGMALAGLQLQANALGFSWKKKIISDPNHIKYRNLFQLDLAEKSINATAKKLLNLPKNNKLTVKGNLSPIALFYLK